MSISTKPLPPPPQKKRGLGCLGCGCLVLALLLLLFLALVGGIVYSFYETVLSITSTAPTSIPAAPGSDDLYQSARQKLADFNHDVMNHQAATVQLSADEINALLAHDPGLVQNNIHTFVSFTGSEGRLQASFPTDAISHGWLKGRYSSLDTSFDVHFDLATKSVMLTPHTLQVEDKPLLGGDTPNQQAVQTFMHSSINPALNQRLNDEIRSSPSGAALLNQAKVIEIQNGQLVLQTQ